MRRSILVPILLAIVLNLTGRNGVECIEWPLGTYGLPEPVTGCPDKWQNGFVYHNTEDENSLNSNSIATNYHLSGIFNRRGIEQSFCIKNHTGNVESTFLKWTPGKYCIYKKNNCPAGMTEGYIHWDEEKSQQDLPTHHEGTLPDGQYTPEDTRIYFCCFTEGNIEDELLLPNDRPFYLFPYEKDQCQKVAGMKDYLEWVYYDDNDEGNRDSVWGTVPYGPNPDSDFNIRLYFCYYEPMEAIVHRPVIDANTRENTNAKVDNQANANKSEIDEKVDNQANANRSEINKKVDKEKSNKLDSAGSYFKRNLAIGSVSLILILAGVGFSIFYVFKKDFILKFLKLVVGRSANKNPTTSEPPSM